MGSDIDFCPELCVLLASRKWISEGHMRPIYGLRAILGSPKWSSNIDMVTFYFYNLCLHKILKILAMIQSNKKIYFSSL